ncbi:hypothetical protein [Kribbella antibiotica]|uniref:hypothetical protein n=1 Tax=Kribbella antibiotica TaxID=190195 RepID=UPI00192DCBE4|nr:hypothetical protein [Kribbella antibiotica]
MADIVHWIGEPVADGRVAEHRFNLVREAGIVPGILWLPGGIDHPRPPYPLVLLGHGGSGHKQATRQLSLARWFAGGWYTAAVAIDGPFHGDRPHHDRMADDWSATLNALIDLDLVDGSRVAYLGLSMGTRLGLPYVAAAGRGLRCAVQWNDELFPRAGQFELFDRLGSPDKPLIAFPGTHRTAAPLAIRSWCEFIVDHLVA